MFQNFSKHMVLIFVKNIFLFVYHKRKMSYIIPPRLKSTDYQKYAMAQDEYLAIQAANDQNIAQARKNAKAGVLPSLSKDQQKTQDELMRDESRQEGLSRLNLIELGFKDREAQQITAALTREPDVMRMMNLNFPAIQTDIKKRINPKLITAAWFLPYIRQYAQTLAASRGLSVDSSAAPMNALVNSVNELKRIMPRREDYDMLIDVLTGRLQPDEIDLLRQQRDVIPTEEDYQRIEVEEPEERMADIQQILENADNLPTREQVARILEQMVGAVEGEELNREAKERRLMFREDQDIDNILDAVPTREQQNNQRQLLSELRSEIPDPEVVTERAAAVVEEQPEPEVMMPSRRLTVEEPTQQKAVEQEKPNQVIKFESIPAFTWEPASDSQILSDVNSDGAFDLKSLVQVRPVLKAAVEKLINQIPMLRDDIMNNADLNKVIELKPRSIALNKDIKNKNELLKVSLLLEKLANEYQYESTMSRLSESEKKYIFSDRSNYNRVYGFALDYLDYLTAGDAEKFNEFIDSTRVFNAKDLEIAIKVAKNFLGPQAYPNKEYPIPNLESPMPVVQKKQSKSKTRRRQEDVGSERSTDVNEATQLLKQQLTAQIAQQPEEAEEFGMGLRKATFKKIKIGRGISELPKQPIWVEFGKFALNLPQLREQDVLHLKYKSMGPIPKFKPTQVSDVLRDFILDLIMYQKVNPRQYKQIEDKERQLFEDISIGAGIWSGLGLPRTTISADEENRKRFDILRGEYYAGNNSPRLIQELRRLVVQFMSEKKISKNDGLKLLTELS